MRRHGWTARARRQFDAWADGYDESLLQKYLFAPAHDALLEEIGRRGYRRVLDIGCGTGVFEGRLVQAYPGCEVSGLDISDKMIRVALEKTGGMKGISFTLGDSERLPFGDGSFDCVTCANSFHHYPRPKAVLAEMRRVISPGGAVMIVDGSPNDILGFSAFQIVVRLFEGWSVHHHNNDEYRKLLRLAGFAATAFKRLRMPLPLPLPLVLVSGQVAP